MDIVKIILEEINSIFLYMKYIKVKYFNVTKILESILLN